MKNATTIDFNAAIKADLLDFETALKLRGMSFDAAIKADLLDFETALKLRDMAMPAGATPAPKKQAKKTKTTKTTKATKAETPKAEVSEKPEWTYSKGGAIIQYAGHNTLKANHLRRVNNAMKRLVEAGFCVSWKRVGCWLYIYHDRKADKRTSADFEKATLAAGWKFHKGAWVDNTMLKDYPDNFRDEQ